MSESLPPKPIDESYWVIPGRFLGGEYPRTVSEQSSREKLRRILAAGVTLFVDLTHPDDPLEPYEHLLDEPEVRDGVRPRRVSIPITDMNVPRPPTEAARVLDAIDRELDEGGVVYLHCWGGIGRTGTLAGCWLVRHGRDGEDALRHLQTLWADNPKSRHWRFIPQTEAQADFILDWHRHDPALTGG
jgi:hypothetical protein